MQSVLLRFRHFYHPTIWFWLLTAVMGGVFVELTYSGIFTQKVNDFSAFYWAVITTFEHGLSPYSEETLKSIAKGFIFSYVYPPPSLLILFPLSAFSYKAALSIQYGINLLCLFAAVYLTFFRLLPIKSEHHKLILALLALLYTLASEPYYISVFLGQINPPLLLLLVCSWYFIDRNHLAAGALTLSLATIFKIYPAFFMLYFLISHHNRLVIYCGAYLSLLCLATLLILPPQLWYDWAIEFLPLGIYSHATEGFSLSHLWSQSLNGFFMKLFHSIAPVFQASIFSTLFIYMVTATLIVVTFYLLLRLKKQDFLTYKTVYFPCLLILMFLVSPWSWGHHLVFIMPTFYFLLYHLIYIDRDLKSWAFFIIALILLLIPIRVDLNQTDTLHQLVLYSKNFYVCMIIWCLYINLLSTQLDLSLRPFQSRN